MPSFTLTLNGSLFHYWQHSGQTLLTIFQKY